MKLNSLLKIKTVTIANADDFTKAAYNTKITEDI